MRCYESDEWGKREDKIWWDNNCEDVSETELCLGFIREAMIKSG